MLRPPPRSPLFPYPPLFRSEVIGGEIGQRLKPANLAQGVARSGNRRAQAEFDAFQLARHQNPGQETRSQVDGLEFRPQTRRSEEHTSELQSLAYLVCRLLLE